MRILLTGFEPFGGFARNSSQAVLSELTWRRIRGVELETLLLPVVFEAAFQRIAARLAQAPALDAIVLTGMAARATRIRLERLAVNLMDTDAFAGGRRPSPRPDNAGHAPVDLPIAPGGPLALPATVDVKRLAKVLFSRGLPVDVSLSAGSYVCNDLYYRTLHALSGREPAPRCLFVHLPELPRAVEIGGIPLWERPGPALALPEQVRTMKELLETLAA